MDSSMCRQAIRLVPAAALIVSLSACMSTTPRWDAQFGDSVRSTVAQQTRNPEAGRTANSADGIDGRAAIDALERYHKSFRDLQPQNSGLSPAVGTK